jgi:hypothetical protein
MTESPLLAEITTESINTSTIRNQRVLPSFGARCCNKLTQYSDLTLYFVQKLCTQHF